MEPVVAQQLLLVMTLLPALACGACGGKPVSRRTEASGGRPRRPDSCTHPCPARPLPPPSPPLLLVCAAARLRLPPLPACPLLRSP